MAKDKKAEKMSVFGSDNVSSAEEIIAADKNVNRQKDFREAYQRIKLRFPHLFLEPKSKKNGNATSGGSFTQNIIVTSEKVKVETKEVTNKEATMEDKDRERDD